MSGRGGERRAEEGTTSGRKTSGRETRGAGDGGDERRGGHETRESSHIDY